MTFFNKQEEVMDIKLTQSGKKLLSIGHFNPVYYAFFDDGITYDIGHISISEDQNESEKRIKQNISFRTQHLIEGVETSFEKESLRISMGERSTFLQLNHMPVSKGREVLKYPLCNSSELTQKSPAFKISCLEGQIYNSASVSYTSAPGHFMPAPEIEFRPKYTLERHTTVDFDSKKKFRLIDSETGIDYTSKRMLFDDGTYLNVKEENILFNIVESGAEQALENFTIECYEVLSSSVDGEENILLTEEEVYDLFSFEVDESSQKTKLDLKSGKFYVED